MSIDASTPAANEELADTPSTRLDDHNRILLVCNQAHILRILKTELEQQGYWVSTARSAERALEKIHANRFCAAVIDADINGMGAVQLCLNINRQVKHNTPQLFLSGATAIELANQKTDWPLNAQGLAWPVSVSYLLESISATPASVLARS